MIPVSISIDNLSEGTKKTAPQEKNARRLQPSRHGPQSTLTDHHPVRQKNISEEEPLGPRPATAAGIITYLRSAATLPERALLGVLLAERDP
jgi:hypothetical protein